MNIQEEMERVGVRPYILKAKGVHRTLVWGNVGVIQVVLE